MDNIGNTLDDFEAVCRDNFREIKSGKACYIYKDDVFQKTKDLCDESNVMYDVYKCDDYYSLTPRKTKKSKKGGVIYGK